MKPGVYLNGVKVKDICSSPCGIGLYTAEFADGPETIYGFPPTDMNPHEFEPDEECCSEAEMAAWRFACERWDLEECE